MHVMNRMIGLTLLLIIPLASTAQLQLQYQENKTLPWEEVIQCYHLLDSSYAEARLLVTGETDAGKPLHLFVISRDRIFTPAAIHAAGKRILFINNGIHPGESNGIDASMEFAEKLLAGKDGLEPFLDNTVVLIVPVFNIGGALNRSPYNRANQNGPEIQGFRGNARYLDLNRDFVKLDTKNARSLVKTIQDWDPDIFADTHCTDGADYPYTVTLISSHPQQLEKPQSDFLKKIMEPALYEAMNRTPYKMIPYVNSYRRSPEKGIEGFYEYPRYLAGYTSTFQILSFTIESHMLKPYPERVRSTLLLLEEMLRFTSQHSEEIARVKKESVQLDMQKKKQVLQWKNDTTTFDTLHFKGYRAKTVPSDLTGGTRLYYDRNDGWEKDIPYFNYFTPVITTTAPRYYIIPGAWQEVIDRLRWNRVQMMSFDHDTTLEVDVYYIVDYQTTPKPYNGHYWHSDTHIRKETQKIRFYRGDVIIPVAQRAASFIMQTLDPRGYDSYFSWNFFDDILYRNEYFSPFLFEEKAKILLCGDKLAVTGAV